ncbi:phytoene/squalene synthase family protein [Rathayibacter soli]|uniref:phytoene/squalene synthase family protein n=1 Tax=Rathayibacter soli TaxID=3144168 RepID=UPI0027E44C41|nr:phytoene/squalene synthase family protein [Glaciibacter superstes]
MRFGHTDAPVGLGLYSRAAHRSSAQIIREYSTSFGMASRLLGRRVRAHVENIYGLVRIADEIVDGAAAEAGLDLDAQRALLEAFEAETDSALQAGYGTNLVVHAFATTARTVGIGTELTAPFFASMRRDLNPAAFTADEMHDYIYGSAEVVGLMCLKAFLHGVPSVPSQRGRLEEGARALGAAFQKINFLRDLRTDWSQLGRNYFPEIDPDCLTEAQKMGLVADIESDLDTAAAVIPNLPADCRTAVVSANGLFAALTRRIRDTPAADLLQTRIRVPTAMKLRIVFQAKTGARMRSTS